MLRSRAFQESWRRYCAFLRQALLVDKNLYVLVSESSPRLSSIMEETKVLAPDSFFYLDKKWIPGLITNASNTRNNINEFFFGQKSYSNKRLRTCSRLYKGLGGVGQVKNLLVIGGNKANVAIREAHSMGINYAATRNTDCWVGDKKSSIFINHNSLMVKQLMLQAIRRFATLGAKK